VPAIVCSGDWWQVLAWWMYMVSSDGAMVVNVPDDCGVVRV
jgi:hypothetical protein